MQTDSLRKAGSRLVNPVGAGRDHTCGVVLISQLPTSSLSLRGEVSVQVGVVSTPGNRQSTMLPAVLSPWPMGAGACTIQVVLVLSLQQMALGLRGVSLSALQSRLGATLFMDARQLSATSPRKRKSVEALRGMVCRLKTLRRGMEIGKKSRSRT